MSTAITLDCIRCGRSYDPVPIRFQCEACGPQNPANLTVGYGPAAAGMAQADGRFSLKLPVAPADMVTMGEGGTPLVALGAVGAQMGLSRLYAKGEWANPTGSFKDRLAAMAVSSAKSIYGAQVIATSSSGNAGVAAGAYAARAGLKCVVFCFGKTTPSMIAQMRGVGASVAVVKDKADRWKLLSQGVAKNGWFPTSPFFGPAVGSNPYGLEGYKAIAVELYEQMDGDLPDWMVLPVCYGDALYGVLKGFHELRDAGLTTKIPRLVAAELFGSLADALEKGTDATRDMPKDRDTAAFSIGATQGTYQSLAALRASNGRAVTVGDAGLLHWHGELARREGLYVETSSAAALAAVETLVKGRTIAPNDSVVCLMTATGLKDQVAVQGDDRPPPIVPPDLRQAVQIIEEHYDTSLT